MTLPTQIISAPSIDVPHHRIHEGNHFIVHKISLGINVANPKYYLIIPPPDNGVNTTEVHMIFEVATDIGGTVELFEGATVTGNGTELIIHNNNRRSTTLSQSHVYEDPTVTTEGNTIFEEREGTTTTGAEIGEFERNDEELILNPTKKYLIKFTPLANGANITFEMNWYDNRPSTPI